MRFVIEGRLDGLNEYTRANRSNRYQGNSMKARNEKAVLLAIREARLKPVQKYPVELQIAWYEPDRRRDVDNIQFAVKFIQDALVEAGILEKDSQKYVSKLSHEVKVDRKNPRIEVTIKEMKEC